MAYSSQFTGSPWLNAQPQKASGLLGLLGVSDNPFLSFLHDHSNALVGLGAGLAGGGPDIGQAIGQGLQLAGQGKTADYTRAEKVKADAQLAAQTNQTKAYLAKNYPDLSAAVDAGLPLNDAWSEAFKRQDATAKGSTAADPADVATYKFYASQESAAGRQPKSFDEWFKGSKQAQKAGLGQPVYGKSKKPGGGYLPFMPMSDGTYASPADPNANPADYTFDPGTVASDKAAGAGYGALQGPAQFNLPKTQQDVETELGNIDALTGNAAGLDQSFGNASIPTPFGNIPTPLPNQWTPTLPNTDKAGFQAQLSQVQGENFLNAYSTLRGAGAITETEGQSAKEAMARLSTAQSKGDFLKALDDLKRILAVGYQRMANQTTMGPYQSSGYTPPALGTGPAAQATGGGGDLKQKYGLE